jgi:hypothetical protein
MQKKKIRDFGEENIQPNVWSLFLFCEDPRAAAPALPPNSGPDVCNQLSVAVSRHNCTKRVVTLATLSDTYCFRGDSLDGKQGSG